jgi:hypothetical protein
MGSVVLDFIVLGRDRFVYFAALTNFKAVTKLY